MNKFNQKLKLKFASYLAKLLIFVNKSKFTTIGIFNINRELLVSDVIKKLFVDFSKNVVLTKDFLDSPSLAILGVENNSYFSILKGFINKLFNKNKIDILVIDYVFLNDEIKLYLDFIEPTYLILDDLFLSNKDYSGKNRYINSKKKQLINSLESLSSEGNFGVIYNVDTIKLQKTDDELNKYTYSMEQKANFYVTNAHMIIHNDFIKGFSFKLNYEGNVVPVRLSNIIAKYQIYDLLPVVILADLFKLNIIDFFAKLSIYIPGENKMKIYNFKNFIVINDSYCKSYNSFLYSIDAFKKIKSRNKAIILEYNGDIGLSNYKYVFRKIKKRDFKMIILVGEKFTKIQDIFLKEGYVLDGNLFIRDNRKEVKNVFINNSKDVEFLLLKANLNLDF